MFRVLMPFGGRSRGSVAVASMISAAGRPSCELVAAADGGALRQVGDQMDDLSSRCTCPLSSDFGQTTTSLSPLLGPESAGSGN